MSMTTNVLHESLAYLFSELTNGSSPKSGFMLNGGDAGLLRSLDTLSAAAASNRPATDTASIAAHVDHVLYGLELFNRWAEGEANPWKNADWTASWRRNTVNDEEWAALRARLRQAAERWQRALETPRELSALELKGVIASIAHLAYHLGAMRQIDRAMRGPGA
jgi:hypothetical protein